MSSESLHAVPIYYIVILSLSLAFYWRDNRWLWVTFTGCLTLNWLFLRLYVRISVAKFSKAFQIVPTLLCSNRDPLTTLQGPQNMWPWITLNGHFTLISRIFRIIRGKLLIYYIVIHSLPLAFYSCENRWPWVTFTGYLTLNSLFSRLYFGNSLCGFRKQLCTNKYRRPCLWL